MNSGPVSCFRLERTYRFHLQYRRVLPLDLATLDDNRLHRLPVKGTASNS